MIDYSHLSEEQQSAVELCADRSKRIVGVTGEAGSGKTTVLGSAYAAMDIDRIALVAPTGRAAKRIEEATGIPAKTIHRLMRWSVPSDDEEHGLPAFDKYNKLPYDAIFVDEASMMSEELYRALIDAMPGGGVIRFFGDIEQLPPVEGASPFKNILEKWPMVRLTHNYRSQDGVVSAARQIIRGRVPEVNEQFAMVNPGAGNILPAIDKIIDDSFRGMGGQVIIPTKVGKYGTLAINNYMQQKLNATGPVFELVWTNRNSEVERRKFRVGDKIIWTKNDYKLNLFNGMIGWVAGFDEDVGDIVLTFDGVDKVIPPHLESYNHDGRAIFQYDPRRNIDHAYAITTHKAQGSEFDKILLVLNKSYVLNRANFYTAVTRAKTKVSVILGTGALATAMRK